MKNNTQIEARVRQCRRPRSSLDNAPDPSAHRVDFDDECLVEKFRILTTEVIVIERDPFIFAPDARAIPEALKFLGDNVAVRSNSFVVDEGRA